MKRHSLGVRLTVAIQADPQHREEYTEPYKQGRVCAEACCRCRILERGDTGGLGR